MNPAVRIALLGFTPFERSHIEAGLLPGDEPGNRYCVTESLGACSLAVVNADDDAAVAQVQGQGRMKSSVMLGTTQRPGAAAQLPRPISLVQLLRTLDQLVDQAPPMSAAVQRVQDDWARLLDRSGTPPEASPAGSATAAMPLIQGRAARYNPIQRPLAPPLHPSLQVLVVDTHDETWRRLSNALIRLGCEAHRLRDCAQALDRQSKSPHAWVFLATGLDGMDSFHTCKTIKRTPANGATQTRVVMLLQGNSAVDQVRAEMAGADACLHKPLKPEQLEQVLSITLADTDTGGQRSKTQGASALSVSGQTS